MIRNYKLILGLLFYGLSSVFYVIALKWEELSVLYPFTSIGYIWVCFLSMKFLDEKMNKLKWLGVITIILGITLTGLGG